MRNAHQAPVQLAGLVAMNSGIGPKAMNKPCFPESTMIFNLKFSNK